MSSSEKMGGDRNKLSILGLFDCPRESCFGCFFQRCLDTGITGKLIGMLVVSLAGFAILIMLNTTSLQKIAGRNHAIRDISIPQYKVGQYILRSINGFKISLLHILNSPKVNEEDRNVLANQQRLADMGRMITALQQGGPVFDVAKAAGNTLDVFTVAPAEDAGMIAVIADINGEYQLLTKTYQSFISSLGTAGTAEEKNERLNDLLGSLDDLYELVVGMTVEVNKAHAAQFLELETIINASMSRSLGIGVTIAVVLSIATLLYILIIVVPLRSILEKITFIAKGEGERGQRIEVKSNDEVGQLAHQLNTLVDNIFTLNSFKALIEEEESTTEVNQRLAALLKERYRLDKIFVYELSGNKNRMTVAFASHIDDVCSPEILEDANFCRAKRTGHDISSLEFPHVCKQFPHKDRLEHHCIPMVANGRVVGVVQFLHPKDSPPENREEFAHMVKRAARYIKEATPVIEAKRFAAALHETTMRDPMTDLYNRRFLESYTDTLVASTMRRKTKIGILMCDMDFFKEVNDTYGHETGDIVLIKTAEVLKSCIRASDMVIRYGGEEFIVLLIDVKSKQEVADLAERIRRKMEETVINVPDGSLQKTMSIGACEFPADSTGFWEAIKYADVALYRAKEEGRNRVVLFSPEMWKEEKY